MSNSHDHLMQVWESNIEIMASGRLHAINRKFYRLMLDCPDPVKPDRCKTLGVDEGTTIGQAARTLLDRYHPGWEQVPMCDRCGKGELIPEGPVRQESEPIFHLGQSTPYMYRTRRFQPVRCDNPDCRHPDEVKLDG